MPEMPGGGVVCAAGFNIACLSLSLSLSLSCACLHFVETLSLKTNIAIA